MVEIFIYRTERNTIIVPNKIYLSIKIWFKSIYLNPFYSVLCSMFSLVHIFFYIKDTRCNFGKLDLVTKNFITSILTAKRPKWHFVILAFYFLHFSYFKRCRSLYQQLVQSHPASLSHHLFTFYNSFSLLLWITEVTSSPKKIVT